MAFKQQIHPQSLNSGSCGGNDFYATEQLLNWKSLPLMFKSVHSYTVWRPEAEKNIWILQH